jgi:hypothetical protein
MMVGGVDILLILAYLYKFYLGEINTVFSTLCVLIVFLGFAKLVRLTVTLPHG